MTVYTDFLADSDAVRDHATWLVEIDAYNTATETSTVLRFGSRRFSVGATAVTVDSVSVAAHTLYEQRITSIPDISSSIWSLGEGGAVTIGGRTTPTVGDLVLDNRDGELDQYRSGYVLRGRDVVIRFGGWNTTTNAPMDLDDYGVIFRGWCSGFVPGLETATIGLVGKEAIFDRPLSTRVYRGTGFCISFNAGSSYADVGACPAELDITGDLTVDAWFRIEATGANHVILSAGAGTDKPYELYINTSNKLVFTYTDSTVSKYEELDSALSANKWYHVGLSVDGTAIEWTLYCWDDDAEVTADDTATTATRDSSGGNFIISANHATNYFQGQLDDIRVWDAARTRDEVRKYRNGPLATPLTETDLQGYWPCDDAAGATLTDESVNGNDGGLSGTYTWHHSLMGDADLIGISVQLMAGGEVYYITPKLVDATTHTYHVGNYVHEFIGGYDLDVFEGGKEITAGTTYLKSQWRTFEATTPSAGTFDMLPDLGLFKLAAQPTLPVTASIFTSPYTTDLTMDFIAQYIGIDSGDTDTSEFASANKNTVGLYVSGDVQASATMDMIAQGSNAWWGFKRGSSSLSIATLGDPDDGSPDYNLTVADIVNVTPIALKSMVYDVRLGWNQTNTVHSLDQIEGTILGTTGEGILMNEWRWVRLTDTGVLTSDQYATSMIVPSFIARFQWYAQSAAQMLFGLYGVNRYLWEVEIGSVGYQMNLGEIVTLSYSVNGTTRLGLDGTKNYAIVGIRDNFLALTTTLQVWG